MNDFFDLPAPADEIIRQFTDRILQAIPEILEGIYITGSIPMRDFYPNKSDIDFIVTCREIPDQHAFRRLEKIHREIAARYPKPDLSGNYISSGSLYSVNTEDIECLSWHEGKMRMSKFEMAPISLRELNQNSITILGQDAETLPVRISDDDVRKFVLRNMNDYWRTWIRQHSGLQPRMPVLFCFPRFTEWAVLGVARQFCTINTGKIVSKTEAGNFALDTLPESYHPIIREALQIRADERSYPLLRTYAFRPSLRRLRQTISCSEFMINTVMQESVLNA